MVSLIFLSHPVRYPANICIVGIIFVYSSHIFGKHISFQELNYSGPSLLYNKKITYGSIE